MSICVAFNLSDGLILAVDSATTRFDLNGSIAKVFLDADKLFQLKNMRIGVATFGVASLHGRTIGSFVHEFAAVSENSDLGTLPLSEVAERLRKFMHSYYVSYYEQVYSLPFEQIPAAKKGALGLLVGGFSLSSLQSELWEIAIPANSDPNTATQPFAPGKYGCRWFALATPINRYANGFDLALGVKLRVLFEEILGRGLSVDEQGKFGAVLEEVRYKFDFDGMPVRVGIDCAKFLIDFVLGHYHFVEQHPIVGGKGRIGVVTYDQTAFQIMEWDRRKT